MPMAALLLHRVPWLWLAVWPAWAFSICLDLLDWESCKAFQACHVARTRYHGSAFMSSREKRRNPALFWCFAVVVSPISEVASLG